MKMSQDLDFKRLLTSGMIVIALMAGNFFYFNRQAEKARQIEKEIGQLVDHAHELNTLEWQTIANAEVDEEARQRVATIFHAIDANIKSIAGNGGQGQAFQNLSQKYQAYRKAIEAEFHLLSEGKIKEARVLDDEQVDPSYNALLKTVQESSAYQIRYAQRIQFVALAGSILVAVMAFGLFLLRFEHTRGEARAAEAERNALRRSEERFRSLVENSTNVIAIVGQDSVVNYLSDSALGIMGRSPTQLAGKPFLDCVASADRMKLATLLASCVQNSGNVQNAEIVFQKSANDYRTLEVLASNRLFDPAIAGIVLTITDITDRVRTAAELSQKAAELQKSNEELEQFAYVSSHDLQEPLRMLASYSQLLAKKYQGKLDRDADEYIGYVIDGAKQMQTLINDLLAYSRVGSSDKQLVATDPSAALKTALASLQVAIAESKAVISQDLLPTIAGDQVQLQQLFQNLIGNAIKYRNGNAPKIHVSCQREGPNWRFSVHDNGIGIDPRFAARIFVIFQRLHTKDVYPGTGIGLAICKKIIERHGGRIWVESELGQGATFYFTVPATAAENLPTKA